jgi:PAS domain S-box-containing protein
MEKAFRKTGIDIIDDAPWGTHLCQFYQTKKDLIDILVPYFKAGLENNEFCMWVTSEPLKVEDAKAALKKVVKNLDHFIKKGQIEILDYSEWYTKSGKFDANNVLQGWVEKENQALKRGYDGLRLSGNTSWLAKRDWRNFTDYEEEVNNLIGKYRMIAICTYSLGKCRASEVIDVVSNHRFALVRREGEWVIIESSDRKRAEEVLRGGEEKYRTILKNIEEGYFEVDIAGNFTFFNDFLSRLLGYSRDEMMGMNNRQYTDKENAQKLYQAFNRVYRTGEPAKGFDWEIIRKDGTKRYIETSVSLIKNSSGQLIGFRGIVRDITERKQTEEALLNAAQQWRTTFDGISDMVCLLDPEGKILRCNNAMAGLLKKPFREIIGRPHWEIVYGTTAPIQECPVMRMRETHRRQTAILPINDRWFNIAVDPLLDETSSLIGAVHIMSDITERKQSDEALRRSEEKYRTILENIEEGYFEVDIAGNFTFFNDSICRIWGYPKEELMGMNDRQYTDQGNAKKLFKAFNKVYRTGEPAREFDWEIIRKDGTKKYIEASVSLQKDPSGKPMGFRGVIRDITERKQTEEEMAAVQEQFRQSQKIEAVGQLAGGIAHDFNNLLTVIKGYSQLSLIQFKESDPLKVNIDEINKATDRAADLIRQLLAFSRRQVMEMRVLDLNILLQNLNKMLRRVIGEDIELVTRLADDLGRVKVDPGQIEQVIMNLTVNARDAMIEGGKLTIETANVELDEEYARTHVGVIPGRCVMLSVNDTGVGITPEVRERIFEPFFTTKKEGEGTGLGLSTVYGIVKQSGGNIWVYSEPEKGTTFKIYLPLVNEPLEEKKERVVKEASPRGNETILVVEDDEVVRKLAVRILREQGYRVLEASQGVDAFLICEEHKGPIHLLVTDVVMPKMSGRELAERITSIRQEVKVLYMSGYPDDTVAHHGILNEGMNYIQKPFTLEGLARKVRGVLDKK